MICIFCYDELKDTGNSKHFKVFLCQDCQMPQHNTLYRVIHDRNTDIKLYDQAQIDDFIITRYYQKTPRTPINTSKIYRRTLDNTPVIPRPVFELDRILEIDTSDLEAVKRKLAIWTTFS